MLLKKAQFLRGKHKPHVSKKLKDIMKTSQLKSIGNNTGKEINLHKF